MTARSNIDRSASRRISWILIGLANFGLLVLLARSPAHSIYDETWFIGTLDIAKQDGVFTRNFLLDYPGTPGPMYTVLLYGLQHFIPFSYPALRLLNVFFLSADAGLIWLLLRIAPSEMAGGQVTPALVAAFFTVLPTVATSGGMTLTEMPSIFFALLFLLGVLLAAEHEKDVIVAALLALLSGLAVAISILGRQNLLLLVFCLPLLIRFRNGMPDLKDTLTLGFAGAVALALVGPIFLLWGGFIPPKLAVNGQGFTPWYGILSLGYAGLIAALLAPGIYCDLRPRAFAGIAAVGLVVTFLFGSPTVPARSVLSRFAGDSALAIMGYGFSFFCALVATAFLAAIGKYLWGNRTDRMTLYCGCAAVVGLLSNAKVTVQFSSRYVFVFLPFLVLALAPKVRASCHLPLRIALGAGIGLLSLSSYYAMD